jgi:NADH-quinone oxidoreductase subunit F
MIRLGADEVNIIYRRSKSDMPAHKDEIKEAEYEKVNIYSQLNPHRIHSENNKVIKLECSKVKGGKFDKSGRRKPVEIEDSKVMIDTDIVISAVGQEVEEYFNNGKFEVKLTNDNLIKTEEDFSTNIDWIFAGGDCVSGPSTVVESIQQGKKAASEIDKYLGGNGIVVNKEEVERIISGPILEEQKSRIKMPTILLSERKRGFKEVEKGYSLDQAVEEASRCLRCDVKEKEEVI